MKEGIVRGAPVGLGRPLPAGKMQRTPSGNSRTMRPESFVGFIGHRHRAKLASLGALQLHRRELLVVHELPDPIRHEFVCFRVASGENDRDVGFRVSTEIDALGPRRRLAKSRGRGQREA